MDDCFMKPDRMRHGYLVVNGTNAVDSFATQHEASQDAAKRNERAAELGIAARYEVKERPDHLCRLALGTPG